LYELRICTAVLENPHCGKSFEPFMKRNILLPSTIALIRSSVVSMSRGGDTMRGRGAADAGRAIRVAGSSASAEASRKKAGPRRAMCTAQGRAAAVNQEEGWLQKIEQRVFSFLSPGGIC